MTEFEKRVYNIVSQIKQGFTMTYEDVARAAGKPRAYRAVGNALNKNHDPSVQCHRVILSNGELGGYNRGRAKKLSLLLSEGVNLKIKMQKSK